MPLMLVEQRGVPLLQAGAVLTVGAIGWTAGSWLQARPWLRLRRDLLITLGCWSVAIGVGIVGSIAFLPTLPYALVAVGWIWAGLGMGLAVSSSSLAAMSLSATSEQGRNASSLNVSDALGSGIFVGVAGTVFAALHPSGNLALTFGLVELSMAAVGLLAVFLRCASAQCTTSSREFDFAGGSSVSAAPRWSGTSKWRTERAPIRPVRRSRRPVWTE